MKANEIIRGVIDLIDQIDNGGLPSVSIAINSTPIEPSAMEPIASSTEIEPNTIDKQEEFADDDIRRFMQIIDLSNTTGNNSPFSNAPNEAYADIDAVTIDAGGGVNNPKHPSDQRVQHPSLYPGYQKAGE